MSKFFYNGIQIGNYETREALMNYLGIFFNSSVVRSYRVDTKKGIGGNIEIHVRDLED